MTVLQVQQRTQPEYRWHACDLKTGRKLGTFPLVGKPSKLIGSATLADFTVDLSDPAAAGKDFWGTTTIHRTLIVLERRYPSETTSDAPWAGAVITRRRHPGQMQSLGCVSVEGLLERRKVSTHSFPGGATDAAIITAIIGDVNVEGWNIGLDLADLTTVRTTVRYKAPERRSALSCLQELSDLENGPEWTIEATINPLDVDLTLRARPRLGSASAVPNAVFRWPGQVIDYETVEDYGPGKGGNNVDAIGNSQGNNIPSGNARNEADIAVAGRWDALVQRPSLRTSAELTTGAAAAVQMMVDGQILTSLTADATTCPQVGRDWVLGDDIRFKAEAHDPDVPGSPLSYGHPGGLEIIARGIGWDLDIEANTMTPTVWLPSEQSDEEA